ncbi:MAG: hypothetical protein WAU28_02935 [Candidatus Moraniibacteriota bacterium]
MILQSEYDAEMRHRRLKVLLIVLTVLLVGVVLYAVIRAGRTNVPVAAPDAMMPKAEEATLSAEEIQKKLDELSKPAEGQAPSPPLTSEEIQKKLDELSKDSNGNVPPQPSPEEIKKKLDELSVKK